MNHFRAMVALRQRLQNTVVAETGTGTFGSTGTGFIRLTGSFVDDGFAPGMEVVATGFADAGPFVISNVEATQITIRETNRAEITDSGRSLSVGIPSLVAWENKKFTPVDNRWYLEEDFVPGPTFQVTVGLFAELEHRMQYVLKLYGLAGEGIKALYSVSEAILAQFPPRLALTMSDGTLLRVRSNPAPTRGQVLPQEAGRAVIVVDIPLFARTDNSI